MSSTWMDLQPERRALMEALNRMEEMRFVGMEFFGNRPDDTHDASIDQVDQCEVFIVVVGHRYGSGITEAEYRRARDLGIPCFAYLKRDESASPEFGESDPAAAAKLAAFKRDLLRGHTVKEFTSPEELAANATADLHNWVAGQWIAMQREQPAAPRPTEARPDSDRTNVLRLLERVEQDWIAGVLEASLQHRAWLELGLNWREDAVEHPWDRIVVAPDRPIKTLSTEDSILGVFDEAQNTLLVLGEPGAGKTTTVLELTRDLIDRARQSASEPVPVVLALSTWRGAERDFATWLINELGLRYQVPKRLAKSWLDDGRLLLALDGLDEVPPEKRTACVEAINAFEQAHHPPGLAVTCRVAEYDALTVRLRLRAAICLQPLTPEQIERYFAAAGAGLDHLRLALREDTGLRELARTPLMLSVMAMAWHDAPAGNMQPAALATAEERRRQLFDAYVEAAMHRRGKATGGYTVEQTLHWLTWLACRMKENGHTLFAIEQLQPGWLAGAWRKLGYFVVSRLLGTLALALPFIVFDFPRDVKTAVTGLGAMLGVFIGLVDFGFVHQEMTGERRASLRFWTLLFTGVTLLTGWGLLNSGMRESSEFSFVYLIMVGLAFFAPMDVRALDIKPSGSIQWSWRVALSRGLIGVIIVNLIVTVVAGFWLAGELSNGDFAAGASRLFFKYGHYFTGLAITGVAVAAVWWQVRPRRTLRNVALVITLVMIGGQFGSTFPMEKNAVADWQNVLPEFMPSILFGVFSGFGSTMIDPSRPRHAGLGFWLRVPALALLVVGAVMTIPGLVWLYTIWDYPRAELLRTAWGFGKFAAACGFVAFLRFGGFNGVQHFLLRWQLSRSGHLPPNPEAFFNHAAQIALMQKVGLGYRFVHALLLEHLVATHATAAAASLREGRPVAAASALPTGPAVLPAGKAPPESGWRAISKLLALVALALGVLMLVWIGVTCAGFWWIQPEGLSSSDLLPFLGLLVISLAVTVPAFALSAKWLRSRSWTWLGGGFLALAAAFAYLTADEATIRRPITYEEVAPSFPGAQQSVDVLYRYGRNRPLAKSYRRLKLTAPVGPTRPEKWRDFVTQRRAQIEADWSALAPVRDWFNELNAFDRIGDTRQTTQFDEGINWGPIWDFSERTTAIASLQALDGRGDDALTTLLPLLQVGCKMELSARVLYRFNQARRMQRQAMHTARFVLDTTNVSPAVRAKFAAVLVGSAGGAGGARHMIAADYAEMFEIVSLPFGQAISRMVRMDSVYLSKPFDFLAPILYRRRASINAYADLVNDLQTFAVQRDAAKAEQRFAEFKTSLLRDSRLGLRNLGGRWLNHVFLYWWSYTGNSIKNYWAMEDLRTALHARLTSP